jgi:hypothetical protein
VKVDGHSSWEKKDYFTVIFMKPQKMKTQNEESQLSQGIEVKNAGMVLASSYIRLLFERLNITSNNKFLNATVRCEAVHYLQYMVTGLSHTDEALLPLNKVLCGMPLDEPVPAGIEISEEHIQLIEGMIKAIIGYWPSIGNTSVDGFRENWLARNGLLTEDDDKWELTVEKRSYDILISRSPFSFSVIKYPWMNKPLYVNWSYL